MSDLTAPPAPGTPERGRWDALHAPDMAQHLLDQIEGRGNPLGSPEYLWELLKSIPMEANTTWDEVAAEALPREEMAPRLLAKSQEVGAQLVADTGPLPGWWSVDGLGSWMLSQYPMAGATKATIAAKMTEHLMCEAVENIMAVCKGERTAESAAWDTMASLETFFHVCQGSLVTAGNEP